MSSELKDLAKQIVDIANGDVKKKTKAYDTTATVTRVDGDTTYVHIPGGVQETPVKTTVGAKKGDVVQVRVANKSAWMVGNASAPPTDDTKANVARKEAGEAMRASSNAIESAKQASEAADHAISKATEAEEAATKAQEDAGRAATAAENAESSASAASTAASQAVTDAAAAQTAANNAGQAASRAQAAADAAQGEIDEQQEYFWHDALGAHVLSDTDEVTGNRYRTDLKGAGQEIFELDGQTETSVAKFGADGARLGANGNGKTRTEISSAGMKIIKKISSLDVLLMNITADGIYTYGNSTNFFSKLSADNFAILSQQYITGYGNSAKNVLSAGVWNESSESSFIIGYLEGSETSSTRVISYGGTYRGTITVNGKVDRHSFCGFISQYPGMEGLYILPEQRSGYGYLSYSYDATNKQTSLTVRIANSPRNGVAIGVIYKTVSSTTNAATGTHCDIGAFPAPANKIFTVGNGNIQYPHNAFSVDDDGNTEAAGDITDGSGNKLSDRASTTKYGMTQLANSYSSTATDKAATPNAVKQAYDRTLTHHKKTITTFKSGWKIYNDDSNNTPILRVCGNVVNLKGAITCTTAKTINATAQTVFTIPSEYAPNDYAAIQACVGSSYYKYGMSVLTTGEVQVSRYTYNNTYPSISAGSWFPFNLTWIID